MDSKRKVNGGGGSGDDLDDRAAKRRKVPSVGPFSLLHVQELVQVATQIIMLLWLMQPGVFEKHNHLAFPTPPTPS
jgi:hypothetical protein